MTKNDDVEGVVVGRPKMMIGGGGGGETKNDDVEGVVVGRPKMMMWRGGVVRRPKMMLLAAAFFESTPCSQSVLPRMPLSSVKRCCHSEISRTVSLFACHDRLVFLTLSSPAAHTKYAPGNQHCRSTRAAALNQLGRSATLQRTTYLL